MSGWSRQAASYSIAPPATCASTSSPGAAAWFIGADCSRSHRRCLPFRNGPDANHAAHRFTASPICACCGSPRSATSATCCRSCARCRTRGRQTRITWIIGKLEHKLLGHVPGIEFVVFDKKAGRAAYRVAARTHARAPLRRVAAHAAGAARQPRRRAGAGPDQARIRSRPSARVAVAVHERRASSRARANTCSTACSDSPRASACATRSMRWDIPLPTCGALEYAERAIPDAAAPTLVISPCSSHALRNWSVERYAAVADHAVAASRHAGAAVRRSQSARTRLRRGHRAGDAPSVPQPRRPGHAAWNSWRRSARATVLLSPDSGPAHMATTVGTPGDRPVCRHQSGTQRPLLQPPLVRGSV